MIKVTYKKANGEIFSRKRNTFFSYKIGDITPIGWEILSIEYKFKDKYYNKSDYDYLLEKSFRKDKKKIEIKQRINLLYKYVNHFFLSIFMIKAIEIWLLKRI